MSETIQQQIGLSSKLESADNDLKSEFLSIYGKLQFSKEVTEILWDKLPVTSRYIDWKLDELWEKIMNWELDQFPELEEIRWVIEKIMNN